MHKYSGAFCPNKKTTMSETFSVGCYETDEKGKQIGAVKVRVRGYSSRHLLVYSKAQEICEQLDAGTYAGPKTVTVK